MEGSAPSIAESVGQHSAQPCGSCAKRSEVEELSMSDGAFETIAEAFSRTAGFCRSLFNALLRRIAAVYQQ